MDGKSPIEFRRLRDYYRRNFINGQSDECFVIWCEDACAQEAGRPSRARLSGLRAAWGLDEALNSGDGT